MYTFARWLLLVLVAPTLRAQTQPAPVPVGNSGLHGVVRDELTHRPLAGVNVKLEWIVPHAKIPRGSATTSLADGSYHFSRLEPHPYLLVVEQPHYLRRTFAANGEGEGQLMLEPGKDLAYDLALLPEAAVEGTVVDAAGVPLAGVSVAAIRERTTHGQVTYDYSDDGTNQTGAPSVTGQDGHYRVGNLPAGTYAVLALVDRFQSASNPASVAALENGSLPVYLGGGFSLQHAARLSLTPGATYRANFKLTPHKRHMIRGTLRFSRPPDATFEEPMASMDEPFDGPRNFQSWKLSYDRKKGTFELGPLVPGEYNLTMATGLSFEKDQFARKTITVGDADLEHVDLTLSPRFSVNVKIVTNRLLPRGEKAPLLRLQRDGESFIEAGVPIDRSGALAFLNLEPGHYTLHLLSQEPLSMVSARFAGQDVLAHGFTLKGPSDAFLEVTLSAAASR